MAAELNGADQSSRTTSTNTPTISQVLQHQGNLSRPGALSSRTLGSFSSNGSSLTPAEAASPRPGYLLPREHPGPFEAPGHNTSTDFFDRPYIPPIPTSKCLQDFTIVIGRLRNAEVEERRAQRRKRQEKLHSNQKRHEATLEELRAWRRRAQRGETVDGLLKNALDFQSRARLPAQGDLLSMAKYYYPLRADVRVFVCDFGDNRFEKAEVPLRMIGDYLYVKPEWSDVRWIHAPLNAGLVQSSLEDRFLKGSRDVNKHKNSTSWPYLTIETLSLRKREHVRNMLDVQKILREGHSALAGTASQLDNEALHGLSEDLLHDLRWRASHTGRSLTYWETVSPDFARQLTGGTAEQPDSAITTYDGLEVEKQMLHTTPLYAHAQVVRSYFRCFQRADDFLLTMSAPGGVDYIDLNLNEHLDLSIEAQAENEECSMTGLLFEIFSQTGNATWYKRNVDWLLVYILTEIAVKPTHIRNGCNAPSILRTYQGIVQDLKMKRYDKFKRKASVNLVRDYLTCIDELTTMSIIFKNTRQLLNTLHDQLSDVLKGERTITPDNERGESAISRVLWASRIVDENALVTRELLSDLQESLTALFQLRSIEQNELAIVADSQNKAILVFTGVTIIFLPLSFFTSYFGMNLKGIVDTSKSEIYFWKLCGTLGFAMFFGIALYAFKHKLKMKVKMVRRARVGVRGALVV